MITRKQAQHKSKAELAERLYPAGSYDFAVPQPIVDLLRDRSGEYIAGELITLYEKGYIFGRVVALTAEAQHILDQHLDATLV